MSKIDLNDHLNEWKTLKNLANHTLFANNRTQDVKSWKQKFNNAEFGSHKNKESHGPKDEKLIQWAGGLH